MTLLLWSTRWSIPFDEGSPIRFETMNSQGSQSDSALLGELWSQWATFGAGLGSPHWHSATRLPGWTMKELFAHVTRSVHVLRDAPILPSGSVATVGSAASYFRSFANWSEAASRQVDTTAKTTAAEVAQGDLVDWLALDGPAVVEASQTAGSQVIRTVAGTIRTSDYVLTRVVEASVHLLDAHEAIDTAPEPQSAALDRVIDVLIELVGTRPFIEYATGRSSKTIFPILT